MDGLKKIRATKKKRKLDRISSVGYHRSDIAMGGMGCLAVANGYMFFVLLLSGFSFVRSFVHSVVVMHAHTCAGVLCFQVHKFQSATWR